MPDHYDIRGMGADSWARDETYLGTLPTLGSDPTASNAWSQEVKPGGPGVKHDAGKARVGLIDPSFILGLADVLTFGAKKYSAHNWTTGMSYERLFNATQRHLLAWFSGEDNDPETGLPHLHHAAFGLMVLSNYQRRVGTGEVDINLDDRPKAFRL